MKALPLNFARVPISLVGYCRRQHLERTPLATVRFIKVKIRGLLLFVLFNDLEFLFQEAVVIGEELLVHCRRFDYFLFGSCVQGIHIFFNSLIVDTLLTQQC
jgi:hypothetical protein